MSLPVFLVTYNFEENIARTISKGVLAISAGEHEDENAIRRKFFRLWCPDVVLIRNNSPRFENELNIAAALMVVGEPIDCRKEGVALCDGFKTGDDHAEFIGSYPFQVRVLDLTPSLLRSKKVISLNDAAMNGLHYTHDGFPIETEQGIGKKWAGNFVQDERELQNLESRLGIEVKTIATIIRDARAIDDDIEA